MSVINTNITSMIGQQNLSKSQSALATSMERLSSGLRINSAKDDAAGQAIANRMTAQITGLSQAQRNANDGISVAQTAEGALNQVNDNLQRIRELSVQAQNDTNSQDDLDSIQAEINQRLSEIDRISSETSFNGVKVLASDQALSIQVGANDGEKIDVNLQEITAATLNMDTFNVNGVDAADLTTYANGDVVDGTGDSILLANVTLTDGGAGTAFTAATLEQDSQGQWYVAGQDADGNDAYIAVDEATAFAITDGAGGGANDGLMTVNFNSDTATILAERSAAPLASIDSALSDVDTLRSDLGAIQNRFESAITNLQTNETNLAAARSRIEDADYAVEVANMTRSQILQQAGTSVLAQANQVPQGVLSLLG
ncbi:MULTISPECIES: FliC/FljB family flagellin [Idiomarina]|uniref:FliC/FljB family flagellin n=1 Tax=Idiomarina TaxID=135575 RepID=UPI00129C60BA|nr:MULTISPECIES: FliC/FljB family flagellin [Idiomarina]MRJ42111.1 FliC/FljB family flagellin [Idiomarina sp. FeN1]NCU57036.1 FliC/FljB family flagellin [Idiomarina sp. FenA--70]NCU59745.1 FliC/FljB family flagellin [Idiomarina sp. FenBw--71]UUN13263.1 FliC/FljB family flagellin [Idiomarina loihiensis]